MSQRNIISVVGDLENFLDSLLAHTEEENCQHSVSDFLKEYFDNKNKNKIVVGTVEGSNNQTKPPHSGATGGVNG